MRIARASRVNAAPYPPTRLTPSRRSGWRRPRRLVGVGLIFAGGFVCFGVWTVSSLSSGVPLWWRTVRRDDPRTIESARRVEDGVWNNLYSVRSGQMPDGGVEWTVALKAADANAWLNARFPMWIANQWDSEFWPAELREIQVDFDDTGIRIGIEIQGNGEKRVLSATIHPAVAEDGSLWMPASWIHVGRLGIPASLVLSADTVQTSGYIPDRILDLPEAQGMMSAFAGNNPMVDNAVVSLGDGRRVRLISLRTRGGWLEITCRTEPEPVTQANATAEPSHDVEDDSAEPAGVAPDDDGAG